MPPVRDLSRVGCALRDRTCVFGRAVACDDLDARMIAEPRRDSCRRPVWSHVDRPPRLEVNQDRAPRPPFAPGPVIDAKHARRLGLGHRMPVEKPEDSVRARRNPEVTEQPRARLGSGREAGADLRRGRRSVRRAWRATRSGNGSANVFRGHVSLRQRNRRTRSLRPTARSLTGRSAGERV